MKMKTVLCALALFLTAVMVMLIPPFLHSPAQDEGLPGVQDQPRQLLRLWVTGAPGGGMAWLNRQLTAFERSNPGVQTYVRQVTPDALTEEWPAPPDILLFMPGDLTAPDTLLLPLAGALTGDDPLLRAGRWQGTQYAAPLCWSAWVLAVDSQYDDAPAATPAPTTLLGRPAPTQAAAPTSAPGYPAEKLRAADTPLLAPKGIGLVTLRMLLEEPQPAPGEAFASLSSAAVYEAFAARRAASALLTTGQLTAFRSLQQAGRGFPCRILTAEEVVTDMVWMAGIASASPQAAALIAYLTSEPAQRALAAQGLFPVSTGMPLYGDDAHAQVEAAARRSLTAINAFLPKEAAERAAWQIYTGAAEADAALPPLL